MMVFVTKLIALLCRLMVGLFLIVLAGLLAGALLVGLILLINFLFGPVIYV